MRPVHQLVHSRARVNSRYALLPLEGFPFSRVPSLGSAPVRVLASPRMGAGFSQYLIDFSKQGCGYFAADPQIETFYYVVSGEKAVCTAGETLVELTTGSFGLVPPNQKLEFAAYESLSVIIIRKRYEPYNEFSIGKGAAVKQAPIFQPLHSNESKVEKTIWAENENSVLQALIPDEFQFDFAMNIFTFMPGYGLPIVETHVMEHGLYFLQGKGVYYLDGDWMEVEKDDFIWMGPYCPQSFYATGPTPSKYLYYKNVNREISL